MSNKLSHSSASKFMQCPRAYQLHYINKIRSNVTHSALLFGSSLDFALNVMLEDYKNGNLDTLGQTYFSTFVTKWREGEVNGTKVDLFDSPDLVYAKSDLDIKLFNDKDWLQILTAGQNVYLGSKAFKDTTPEAIMDVYYQIQQDKESKGWDNLPLPVRKFYNHVNWLCLCKKGTYMLRTYLTDILPRIKKVLAIQKEIKIENDNGDVITGFIDLVAELDDGKVYVIDNKTAAREYEWDAVQKSTQLALYVHAVEHEFNTRNAAFIVLSKNIDKNAVKTCGSCNKDLTGSRVKTCDAEIAGKRCGGEIKEVLKPKASYQMLLNEIPARLDELVLENMMDVNDAINTGIFPRNLNSCTSPFLCPYLKYCHEGSMHGLVDMNKKKLDTNE